MDSYSASITLNPFKNLLTLTWIEYNTTTTQNREAFNTFIGFSWNKIR